MFKKIQLAFTSFLTWMNTRKKLRRITIEWTEKKQGLLRLQLALPTEHVNLKTLNTFIEGVEEIANSLFDPNNRSTHEYVQMLRDDLKDCERLLESQSKLIEFLNEDNRILSERCEELATNNDKLWDEHCDCQTAERNAIFNAWDSSPS